ncbi:D-hexose-6-phosphate mutarotase, partial [Escherichia marmotae]|nr:D-hexose-6-phosphate mutarotase [Escherichia marmotae]
DCSVFNDDALKRIITVGHQHHLNVFGWNPGPALSVSMGDMRDDGYKTFVCVETAYASVAQKTSKDMPSRVAQSIRVAKR